MSRKSVIASIGVIPLKEGVREKEKERVTTATFTKKDILSKASQRLQLLGPQYKNN